MNRPSVSEQTDRTPVAESGARAPVPRMATLREFLVVATIAALYLYIFVRVQWRIGDEGDILNGALAVAQGRVPYRDFFDLRGPASFYWLGLFFKVFGATWQVARVHLLLTGTLTSLLVYHLTRRVYWRPDAVLPCALVTVVSIPSWPASHHHWDSNLFALAAVAAFFAWQDHAKLRWLFTSGVLAGLASCFIPQKGFFLLVSFLAIMLISRLQSRLPAKWARGSITVLAGYGAVGLAVLAWFAHLGALQEFLDSTVRIPLNTYVAANKVPYAYHLTWVALGNSAGLLKGMPQVLALPSAFLLVVPAFLVAALPFLVIALAAVYLVTRPIAAWFRLPIIAYCLTGFALWSSEFHRADIMHLIYGCPLLLIAAWLLWASLDRPAPVRILVPSVVGLAVLLFAVSQGWRAASAREQVVTRRGTIVLPQDDLALRFLLSDEVARGDYVFVYPYYSTYYFLADVRNPTRFGQMMYGPHTKPFFDEAIAAIETKRVKCILWDTVVDGENLKTWFPTYEPPPRDQRPMERYLQEHYEQQAVLSGFRLLRRRFVAASSK